jgi:hypothetical protein
LRLNRREKRSLLMYKAKFSTMGGCLTAFSLRSVVRELAALGEISSLLGLGLWAAQATFHSASLFLSH